MARRAQLLRNISSDETTKKVHALWREEVHQNVNNNKKKYPQASPKDQTDNTLFQGWWDSLRGTQEADLYCVLLHMSSVRPDVIYPWF